MPVWRGAASGALTGVKKNAVILLRWLLNYDYVTVMLPVLLCSGPAEAHLNSTGMGLPTVRWLPAISIRSRFTSPKPKPPGRAMR